MIRGYQYFEEHQLLVHHLTRNSIFDEVSYILTLTELIGKVQQYNPKKILLHVKSKRIHNYDAKFSHWVEKNVFPEIEKAGVQKVAFVLPHAIGSYKKATYEEAPKFEVGFFGSMDDAKSWLGVNDISHPSLQGNYSEEMPL